MEQRVHLQPVYVLHRRPFQNTSLLLDFFCMDYGRVRGIARGVRGNKSRSRSLLQLFHPLLVSFSGRGEVKTVGEIESGHAAITLQGQRLFSGLYVNELLTRMLLLHVEHKSLFLHYQDTLVALQGDTDMELVLRRFELKLLAELGYAINLQEDCRSHDPIAADKLYRFTPDVGFECSDDELSATDGGSNPRLFRGEHLIALREFELGDRERAQAAKRLLRLALNAHLGDRPLHSRSLFAARTT
jgi:DNA repair protein RecO (recombination protein O)